MLHQQYVQSPTAAEIIYIIHETYPIKLINT